MISKNAIYAINKVHEQIIAHYISLSIYFTDDIIADSGIVHFSAVIHALKY